MLLYIKRPKEVYQKLKGCPVQREVYDALDFHRPPHSNISDRMTYAKLAKLSDTDRRADTSYFGSTHRQRFDSEGLDKKEVCISVFTLGYYGSGSYQT